MKTLFRWRTKRHVTPDADLLARAMRRAAELARLPDGDWILSVDFVNDQAMRVANRDLVGHVGTTDVITFNYFEADAPVLPDEIAVELIVCTDVARREGAKRPTGYAYELMLYLVHGLLHSAGEDDLTKKAAESMRRREAECLTALAAEFDFRAIFPELATPMTRHDNI